MRSSVSTAWPDLVTSYEGRVSWLYLDTKSLVTTGVGFLMDNGTGQAPDACLRLPWADQGAPANRVQIETAWDRVKARTDLAPRGGYAFRDITALRLPEEAIGALLTAKTLEFWSVLVATLPGLEQWSADAQLALMDMAWHLGPYFLGLRWPNFTAAAHAEDFAGMAEHCQTANRTPRDARHVRLFSNAATVVELGLDREVLWDQEVPNIAERLTPPYDTGNGRTCTDVIKALPLVEYRFVQRGWIKRDFSGLIFQWGYKDNAIDASSTTHNGGGVFDVAYAMVDSDTKMRVWQECGFTPFRRRPPQWSLTIHGHVLVNGCNHLDPLAARQITDYRSGENGLGGVTNHTPYDGPTGLYRTWQQAQIVYKDLIEEMNMPTPKEFADAIAASPLADNIAKAVVRRLLQTDDLVNAGKDEANPANTGWWLATYVKGDHDLLVDLSRDVDELKTAILATLEAPPA